MLQQIFFSLLFALGVYLLSTVIFVRPTPTAVQAVTKIKNFSLTKRYETTIKSFASRIEKFVRISDYKRNDYLRMLEVLGQSITPEQFTAKVIVKAILFFALGLLLGMLYPFFFIMAPVLPAIIYWWEFKAIKKQYLKRKTDIELDLPKLCSVINSRLQSTSNVQTILSSFLPIANSSMAAELTVTLADMRTGSAETALRRFEGRISSPKVSDVVRGLIAVQNGDDMRIYFQSKQHQFNNDYTTIKKKQISARPIQLSMPGLLAFLIFFVVILYTLSEGIQQTISQAF